jgi:hypothetical protein
VAGVVTLEVELAPVLRLLKRVAPEQLNRAGVAAMNESLGYLQSLVQAGTPVDQGRLRMSIFTDLRGSQFPELRGRVASVLEYAVVREYGRRSRRFPPLRAIAVWARRHGMTPYVAARAIALRPGPGAFMFRRAAERGETVVIGIFRRHLGRLLR